VSAAFTLPIARVEVPGLEVFALARETGLTAYDAAYLWVSLAMTPSWSRSTTCSAPALHARRPAGI